MYTVSCKASYAAAAQAQVTQGAGVGGPVQGIPVPTRISYVTDSIGHNVNISALEKLTKTKISKRKAYGAIKKASQKFPNSNFTDIVPVEMSEKKPDILVLQQDSVTLTDLPTDASDMYLEQEMKVTSYNMFAAATAALAANPGCQQAILMEAIPRYDGKEKMNRYGNMMLHQAKMESTSIHKDKVTIGSHNLDCDGGKRASRYGDHGKTHVDMIHMRRSSGLVAYARSVAAILARAGLASRDKAEQVMRSEDVKMKTRQEDSFQTQGRRGRKGPRGQQQQSTFQLAVQNRWNGLQGRSW